MLDGLKGFTLDVHPDLDVFNMGVLFGRIELASDELFLPVINVSGKKVEVCSKLFFLLSNNFRLRPEQRWGSSNWLPFQKQRLSSLLSFQQMRKSHPPKLPKLSPPQRNPKNNNLFCSIGKCCSE